MKDSQNTYHQSRYADLAACHAACESALAAHGLAILQTTHWQADGGVLILVTTLAHTSGEQLEAAWPVLADYGQPQKVGAALTYGRRYSYMAAVGIAPEDDDGELASGRGTAPAANGHTNGNGHNSNGKPHVAAHTAAAIATARGRMRGPLPGKELASKKQISTICRIADERGVTADQLANGLRRDFHVERLEELERDQASALINRLSSMPYLEPSAD